MCTTSRAIIPFPLLSLLIIHKVFAPVRLLAILPCARFFPYSLWSCIVPMNSSLYWHDPPFDTALSLGIQKKSHVVRNNSYQLVLFFVPCTDPTQKPRWLRHPSFHIPLFSCKCAWPRGDYVRYFWEICFHLSQFHVAKPLSCAITHLLEEIFLQMNHAGWSFCHRHDYIELVKPANTK